MRRLLPVGAFALASALVVGCATAGTPTPPQPGQPDPAAAQPAQPPAAQGGPDVPPANPGDAPGKPPQAVEITEPCRVDPAALPTIIGRKQEQTGKEGAWSSTWFLTVRNDIDVPLLVVYHQQFHDAWPEPGQRPDAAKHATAEEGWLPNGYIVEPGESRDYPSQWTRYPKSRDGVTVVFWDYVDRIAVFRMTPDCTMAAPTDTAALEAVARPVADQPIGK